MTVTGETPATSATQRAFEMLTAFEIAEEGDDPEEHAAELLLQNSEEIVRELRKLPIDEAAVMMSDICMSFAGIIHGLLEDCADAYEMDKYDLLQGLALSIYGSECDDGE